jgi:hypothetical protein
MRLPEQTIVPVGQRARSAISQFILHRLVAAIGMVVQFGLENHW